MKKDRKLIVFIIDDDFPKPNRFINQHLFDKELNKEQLKELVKSENWKGDRHLLEICRLLINHDYTNQGLLDIFGFLNPEICLTTMKKKIIPDIVIYDWEYGDHQYQKSSNWLLQILIKAKKAFVFVYSGYAAQAPPYLNKDDFKPFANRFQLFLKGEKETSVFSSEEFIFQYVLSRLSNNNTIRIQDMEVEFTSSGRLAKSNDILYLENIMGKNFLISQLKSLGNKINKETLDIILETFGGKVLLSKNKKFLVDSDQEKLIENFNAKYEISYLDVVKKYGVKKLLEVINSGLAKVS